MQSLIFRNSAITFGQTGEDIALFLSQEESQYIENCCEKRKAEYIHGRFAAKKSLSMLTTSEASVLNDSAGKPYFSIGNFGVSITHSRNIVAAIAFPQKEQYGIDLEYINPKHTAALRRKFQHDDITELTTQWTIYESLYKIGERDTNLCESEPSNDLQSIVCILGEILPSRNVIIKRYANKVAVSDVIQCDTAIFCISHRL